MTRKKYTGPPNSVRRPRKGDRLKASDVASMQASIAEMQSKPGESMRQIIEMVRVPSDIATDSSVDCFIQGYDVATTAFSDIGTHAKRSVYNPYSDTITTGVIPVVRIGGAVVPVRGGGGGGAIMFKTRTGGIAARTTTTLPHTFPSATVDLIDPSTGNVFSPNQTETVYNMTNIAITHVANRPRQAKKIGGRYFIDVDDC